MTMRVKVVHDFETTVMHSGTPGEKVRVHQGEDYLLVRHVSNSNGDEVQFHMEGIGTVYASFVGNGESPFWEVYDAE